MCLGDEDRGGNPKNIVPRMGIRIALEANTDSHPRTIFFLFIETFRSR